MTRESGLLQAPCPAPTADAAPEYAEATAIFAQAHLLPCTVHHTGAANVSRFFLVHDPADAPPALPQPALETNRRIPTEKVTAVDREQEARFRGRKLRGSKVQVPKGYAGACGPPPLASRFFCLVNNLESSGISRWPSVACTGQACCETTWEVAAQFTDFTVWGHDIGPDPLSDQYIGAMDWLEGSEVVRVRHSTFCREKSEPWEAF
ncbi:MAG: hypothetical protein BJ554DRAFT_7881 [Olpidium bornovanus]|uniref:Uncharacterized protein n=1 Tax=Olpidium bornovanus TaxID=278681 RepID=A0A8H7ZVT0_9FUNG|nr:MAG: hypothetical protein BJ554DRAFT_7881 [Olpidium bornovanus]